MWCLGFVFIFVLRLRWMGAEASGLCCLLILFWDWFRLVGWFVGFVFVCYLLYLILVALCYSITTGC